MLALRKGRLEGIEACDRKKEGVIGHGREMTDMDEGCSWEKEDSGSRIGG